MTATLDDVSVNHGRVDVGMAQKLLNSSNVIAVLGQVGRK